MADTRTFEVEVISRSDTGALCRRQGAPFWVAQNQMPRAAKFPEVGTRGPLTLYAWAAEDLGLLPRGD